ncbi:MipA/OmpV family protein [Roseateles sp. DB2]|uniref:MipA/OmpV family protein n=1 Tax=Roseateles sp. DB2 TaxID=3453717 RepID=UPI003EEEF049
MVQSQRICDTRGQWPRFGARQLALGLVMTALLAAPAHAGEAATPPKPDEPRYLLGLRVSRGSEYPGSRRQEQGLTPLWALYWGRWRITTAGTGAMMGFGSDAAGPGPGASRDWLRGEHWKLGLGLRIDSGRNSDQAAITRGLPDVPRTLRGRLQLQVELSPQWTLSAACSPDLLNHRGGTECSVDFSRSLYRSGHASLALGLGLSASDRRHLQSYFGVPEGSEAAERLGRSYAPGSGLTQGYVNLSYMQALSPRWVLVASWSEGRLLDAAAASPLVQTRRQPGLSVGLAYRH